MTVPTPATTTPVGAAHSEETVLAWSVHLARRDRPRLLRMLLVLALVFALGAWLFGSLLAALLPPLALVLSLSEFFFPVRCRLSATSAHVRHGLTVLEIRWADVRHAYLTPDGVKLSPLRAKNARWEPLRGVFLRFGDADPDLVAAAVRRLREEAGRG